MTELTKHHLKHNNIEISQQFSIPKLGSSESGFIFPQINFSANSSTSPKLKINELTEFSQLNLEEFNPKKTSNFVISNVSGSKSVISTSSAFKDKLPNVNSDQTLQNENWVIDLKSALVPDFEPRAKKSVPGHKEKSIEFVPQFIDCENTNSYLSLEFNLSDPSDLFYDKTFEHNKFVEFSSVGKIISKKFRKRHGPFVSHEFVCKHMLIAFDFKMQSPDDQRLKYLNEKK